MQAAVAETPPQGLPMPADLITKNEDDQPENQIGEADLVGEMMHGFDRLRRMSRTELRDVIGSRVALLENELHEREARRAVLKEAQAASRPPSGTRQTHPPQRQYRQLRRRGRQHVSAGCNYGVTATKPI